jgi:anti-sigma factor RsiW
MDCRTVHDHLSAYLDLDLPSQTRDQFDTHLRRCARCRREFTQLQTVTAWVRNLPLIEPSPTFLQHVCQRLERLPHRSPAGLFRRLTGALPFQMAAALVVAVSAALVWHMAPDRGQRQVQPLEPPARIEPWLSRDRTATPTMEVPPLEQIFEDALPTPTPLVQAPAGWSLFVSRGGPLRSARDVSTMPMATGVPS